MKKALLSSLLFLALATLVNAQSLTLPNDSIYIGGTINDNLLVATSTVTNTTSGAVKVRVRRTVQTVVPGTQNYFCWSACHSPSVSEDPDYVEIAAGATASDFYADYLPQGQSGQSIIFYTFFNHDMPSDSVRLKVVFDIAPTGIASIEGKNNFALYPNPANDFIRVKYNFDNQADLIIYDITGKMVRRESLIEGQTDYTFSIADLKSGVYFYSVNNGKDIVSMKKLIKK
jgi:hypothetical protein